MFTYEEEASSQKCSIKFDSKNNPNGYLQTINYPSHYPNDLFCVFEFQGKLNERVILLIEDFELEPAKVISILDSEYVDVNEPGEPIVAQSGRNIDSDIVVEIMNSYEFDIMQCFYDYLDVYTYNMNDYYEWSKRYCGDKIEPQIVSTTPNLKLVFGTDRNLQYKGFKIKFYFSYVNILPFITTDICGQTNITGNGGILTSPNYPAVFPYNLECAWTITVSEKKRILIKFIDLNFNEGCHESYVHIWDGYVDKVDKPSLSACQKLSFYLKSDKHILTKTNRAVIKFNGNKAESTLSFEKHPIVRSYKSNYTNNNYENKSNHGRYIRSKGKSGSVNHGFLISWTAVYEDPDCQEFLCKGGEYCIDSSNLICTKTRSYCIDKSLVCDGYNHCDVGDNSDEEACNLNFTTPKLYIMMAIIASLLFILLLITCLIVHIIKKKIKIKRQLLENSNSTSTKTSTLNSSSSTKKYQSDSSNGGYKKANKKQKKNNEIKFQNKLDRLYHENGLTNIQAKRQETIIRLSKSFPDIFNDLVVQNELLQAAKASSSVPSIRKRPSYVQAQSFDLVPSYRPGEEEDENVNYRVDFLNIDDPAILRRNSYNRAINL